MAPHRVDDCRTASWNSQGQPRANPAACPSAAQPRGSTAQAGRGQRASGRCSGTGPRAVSPQPAGLQVTLPTGGSSGHTHSDHWPQDHPCSRDSSQRSGVTAAHSVRKGAESTQLGEMREWPEQRPPESLSATRRGRGWPARQPPHTHLASQTKAQTRATEIHGRVRPRVGHNQETVCGLGDSKEY